MDPNFERLQFLSRRHFLKTGATGLGAMAIASLLNHDAAVSVAATDNPLAPKPPQFPGKAKRVIYLHLTGSPPHLDLWDYKPELVKRDGQDCPDEFLKGKTFRLHFGHAETARHAPRIQTIRQEWRVDVGCDSASARSRR